LLSNRRAVTLDTWFVNGGLGIVFLSDSFLEPPSIFESPADGFQPKGLTNAFSAIAPQRTIRLDQPFLLDIPKSVSGFLFLVHRIVEGGSVLKA
jgi:hypothetical protein